MTKHCYWLLLYDGVKLDESNHGACAIFDMCIGYRHKDDPMLNQQDATFTWAQRKIVRSLFR